MIAAALAVLLAAGAAGQQAPQVVATVPAEGANVAPGPFVLTVTFNQPMQPGSWSFVRTTLAAYPDCDNRPVQSADGRSFSMACRAQAGLAYAIAFNGGRFRNFRAASGGASAAPMLLRFHTL